MAVARIRRAEEGDAGELALLCGALGYPVSEGDLRPRLSALLAEPRRHAVFVAVGGEGASAGRERVVGLCHATAHESLLSAQAARISALVVEEGRRGQGVGRALVARAEAWACDQGFSRLLVRARTSRADAHAFYGRIGFGRSKEQLVLSKEVVSGDGAAKSIASHDPSS